MSNNNEKLQNFIDEMMESIGITFPEELVAEYRKKRIVVADDDGNIISVLREGDKEDNGKQ